MNDIIKLILFNLLLISLLYYDKRNGFIMIILMIIYWITIKSSMKNKLVEGNGFFSDFVKMPDFIKEDVGAVLPTSVQNNSVEQEHSSLFSFFKGIGNYGTVKNNVTRLEETNDLLDELINVFENKQQNCKGEFKKFSECSRECGRGSQEQVYRIIQDKGENGLDCKYKEGHKIRKPCILKSCALDEKCRSNDDCRSGLCEGKGKEGDRTCSMHGTCDDFNLNHCYNEDDCLSLNKNNEHEYKWDSNNDECNKESKIRTEYNIYGEPDEPIKDGEIQYYKCNEKNVCVIDDDCNEEVDGCYTKPNCDDKCGVEPEKKCKYLIPGGLASVPKDFYQGVKCNEKFFWSASTDKYYQYVDRISTEQCIPFVTDIQECETTDYKCNENVIDDCYGLHGDEDECNNSYIRTDNNKYNCVYNNNNKTCIKNGSLKCS